MVESRSERLKLFKEAATNYGFKKVTIDKLVADDFDSLDTAELLAMDDIQSFELTKGQLRLLERWMHSRQTAKTASTPRPVDHTSGDADPEEDASTLWRSIGRRAVGSHGTGPTELATCRAYLIQDYVSRVGHTDNDTPLYSHR